MPAAYQATYRNKRGDVIATQYDDSAIEAARLLFGAYPKADSVQVCNAYVDHKGDMQGNGLNIHWINRRDVSSL